MTVPDSTPGGLEMILLELESHFAVPASTANDAHRQAIAAIEALLPEKLPPHANGLNTEWESGYHSAIDQIHHNFKGDV